MNTRFARAGMALVAVLVGIGCVDHTVFAAAKSVSGTKSTVASSRKSTARATKKAPTKVVALAPAQSISSPFVIEASNAALEERGRAALKMLLVNPVETFPGWTVSFRPGRDRLLGLTLVSERRVEIYIRDERPLAGIAHDLAHELGHVFDVSYNSTARREAFLSLRGLNADTQWWACDSCRDLEVGAGDFAEVFAHLIGPPFAFYSQVKARPDARVSDLIRTQILAPVIRSSAATAESVPVRPDASVPVRPDATSVVDSQPAPIVSG